MEKYDKDKCLRKHDLSLVIGGRLSSYIHICDGLVLLKIIIIIIYLSHLFSLFLLLRWSVKAFIDNPKIIYHNVCRLYLLWRWYMYWEGILASTLPGSNSKARHYKKRYFIYIVLFYDQVFQSFQITIGKCYILILILHFNKY